MNRNMNRADARRADKSRRRISSRVGTTPNCSASDLCPVRLSAIYNEQVLRNTWMDCLRELREHLTEIKRGVNFPDNMEAAMHRIGCLGLIVRATSREQPCCLEANLNKARMVKFADTFPALGLLLFGVDEAVALAKGTALISYLIDSVLEGLPSAEDLAGIVNDFPVPFCLCSSCGESYHGASTVFQCRHCHSILEMVRHSYVPG